MIHPDLGPADLGMVPLEGTEGVPPVVEVDLHTLQTLIEQQTEQIAVLSQQIADLTATVETNREGSP